MLSWQHYYAFSSKGKHLVAGMHYAVTLMWESGDNMDYDSSFSNLLSLRKKNTIIFKPTLLISKKEENAWICLPHFQVYIHILHTHAHRHQRAGFICYGLAHCLWSLLLLLLLLFCIAKVPSSLNKLAIANLQQNLWYYQFQTWHHMHFRDIMTMAKCTVRQTSAAKPVALICKFEHCF